MVSASKILTVSYGTFSCTLEGFDDPFSTMRSIAEYFRDLAADDRYFGAEPPTPDAEMLHRIAEREIQRKVDARVEDNNIVLRQMDSPLPEGKAEMVPGEALLHPPEPTETALNALTHKAHEEPKSGPKPQESTQETPVEKQDAAPAKLTDSSIAAKLQRIRAVVGNSQAAEGIDTGNNLENGLGDDFFAGSPAAVPAPDLATDIEDELDEGAPQSTLEIPDTSAAEAETEVEAQSEPFAQTADIAEIAPQDVVIEEASKEVGDVLDAVKTELTADVTAETSVDDFEEDIPQTEAVSETKAKESEEGEEDDLNILSDITATLEDKITPPGTPVEDSGFADEFEDEFDEDENAFAEESSAETALKPVAIARIKKVRRTEWIVAQQLSDETAAAKVTPISDFSSDDSTLPKEDEAALLAELAQVESQAAKESLIISTGQVGTEVEATLTAFDDGDFSGTDALDRIMAETNTKLESDEASRKRTSIAHLRAAVQAKRAETQVGGPALEEDTSEEYREDLARAVQPRPPSIGPKSANTRRLAPLVLVSEQRVDEITAPPAKEEIQTPKEPINVRPRRVRKVESGDLQSVDTASDAQGSAGESKEAFAKRFTVFATQNQAKGISEWFEAAAAFRTFIIGQETFSRPQLMGLVLKTSPDSDLTRETALAAFGQLIREGTIQKIQRGRYTISENTRFRPDQERARA